MELKVSKTITTDVLVIGGGGSGVYAAIEAVRAGADTVIVSKGKIGNSGNTIMIGGSYSMDGYNAKHVYGFEAGDDSITPDYLFEQIVKQSFYLSEQDLVQQFVEDSPACVYEMHGWIERAGQKQLFIKPAGWNLSGCAMGRGLRQGLKENPGIGLYEDIMIVDLLKKGDNVIGALGIDIYTGDILHFAAKAVVLATGGYQPFKVKSTNSDMTGDGMAIAYRAGAALADMEFLLPCVTALEPEAIKGSLMPFIYEVMNGIAVHSMDKNGNHIKIPDDMRDIASGSELEKLIMTYYWSEAIAEGRGLPDDGMYYDLSNMSDKEIADTFDRYMDMMSLYYPRGYYHGDSIMQYRDFILANGKKVKVGAVFEYSMGGIFITKNMETTVPGLYAAGETGSGVFGASRIADATTEMLVQGWKAGHSAGQYAKQVPLEAADQAQIDLILQDMARPLGKTGTFTGVRFLREIETSADNGFGICRSESNLKQSIDTLFALTHQISDICVAGQSLRYNYDFIRALQAKNLLTCTLAGLRAAQMRKESRGFHIRHDYPKVDHTHWARRILVCQGEKGMALSTRLPTVTKIPLPSGTDESIPMFIKNHGLNFKNADFS